jgi:hypothetical protein
MQRPTGRPLNVSDWAIPIGDGHYGFADFDYPMTTGVQTRTYMVIGTTYFEMPLRASLCLLLTVLIPIVLIVVSATFVKRRQPAA